METRVQWTDGVAFKATTGSGHEIMMDGAPDMGGRNLGARPMEMLLVGLGGCSAFDVVHILKRSREPVENVDVTVRAERAETDPKVFTKIHLAFIVSGNGLKPEKVERAVSLSAEKYCSASIMLAKTAEVTHSVTLKSGT